MNRKQQKLTRPPFIFALALLFTVLGIPLAGAHSGATGVVKERMDRMQAMKEGMKIMGEMIKGKTPFEEAQIQQQSRRLLEASHGLPDSFPMESMHEMHGVSEALPAIWHEWDRFVSLSSNLDDQAARLESLATGGDRRAIKVQFVQVAKACRACHADYRQKKAEGEH